MRPIKRLLTDATAKRIIAKSGLFDADWYTACYEDLRTEGKVDLLGHYVRHGAAEGRWPNALFDPTYYLSQFPDLDPAEVNPLCHYIVDGDAAGAWPNPYFNPAEVSPQLPPSDCGAPTLSRYVRLGATRINPSARFDANAYIASHPYLEQIRVNPLVHSLWSEHLHTCGQRAITSELSCTEFNQLEPVGALDGQVVFRITGNDPYFVLVRADGKPFEPGYHEMSFTSTAGEEELRSAKAYFDHGEGYSESFGQPLNFNLEKNGLRRAFISLDKPVEKLRIDPRDNLDPAQPSLTLGKIQVRPVGIYAFYLGAARNRVRTPRDLWLAIRNSVASLRRGGIKSLIGDVRTSAVRPRLRENDYTKWLERYDTVTPDDRKAMRRVIDTWENPPLISVVMPTYNTPEGLLREAIESVLTQTYENWEFCIADDASPQPQVREILSEYAARDPRFKIVFREENGHISKSSNSALDIVTGDWVALLDHDDQLAPQALFCLAETIIRQPDVMMIYSDEDKIDMYGNRKEAYFKSDWNYYLFLSHNMFSHLGAYRTDLLRKIGGFRVGLEGAQDYDLALRCLDHLERRQIVHLPHVLYHWRQMPGSTALSSDEKPYAMIAGERALTEHLQRRGVKAKSKLIGHGYQLVIDDLPTEPSVDIIMPSRDGGAMLQRCVESLISVTDYKNYRLVLVDNGSVDPQTLAFYEEMKQRPDVLYIRDDSPFNYSRINNDAARQCNGEIILFLNDDMEIHDGDWLTEMVKQTTLPETGAVGARLWYPNGLLQHGGLVLSPQHIAINIHKMMTREAFGYFGRGVLRQELSAVTAACMAVRRDIFEKVGGFDAENLAVAYNDVDLCLRIREAGFVNVLLPNVNLTHHESATRGSDATREKRRRWEREKRYMTQTWGHLLNQDPYFNTNLTTESDQFMLSYPPRRAYAWKNKP
jgi:O-antigen biosynthesis protein